MMLYIFDMGGVLARAFDVLPVAAGRMGIAESDARHFAKPLMDALMAGSMSASEFWARFEAASGFHAGEDYWSTLFEPTLDREVEAFIHSLRKHGRVVCGTNTVQSHYDYLRNHGMYDCFDTVYASHLMGFCKPDQAFWRAILLAEHVEPRDAYFVDDYAENVAAAEALGIRSHLFTDVAGLVSAMAPGPCVAERQA